MSPVRRASRSPTTSRVRRGRAARRSDPARRRRRRRPRHPGGHDHGLPALRRAGVRRRGRRAGGGARQARPLRRCGRARRLRHRAVRAPGRRAPHGALASAGHPPPLLLSDAGADFLPLAVGAPIGADRAASYEQVSARVPAGARIVTYTDGLVERWESRSTTGSRACVKPLRRRIDALTGCSRPWSPSYRSTSATRTTPRSSRCAGATEAPPRARRPAWGAAQPDRGCEARPSPGECELRFARRA